jgi:hypothetical protein
VIHKTRGIDRLGFEDKVETEALNIYFVQVKYYNASRLVPHIIQYKASHDIVQHHLLWPNTYTSYNTTCIVCVNTTCIVHTKCEYTINSYIVPAYHGILVHDTECTRITYAQYCQMYVHAIAVPANHNIIPSFRWLFYHRHTLLTGVLSVMLCPLRRPFIMINSVIVICIGQLTIAQEA